MSNLLISSGENDCTLLNCSLRRMLANCAATYAAMPPAAMEQATLPTEQRIIHMPSFMMASASLPSLRRTVILDMYPGISRSNHTCAVMSNAMMAIRSQ